MSSGAPDREGRFIEARQSFLSILLGSWAFFPILECSSWFPSVLGTELGGA
jgi:hypothetical protein